MSELVLAVEDKASHCDMSDASRIPPVVFEKPRWKSVCLSGLIILVGAAGLLTGCNILMARIHGMPANNAFAFRVLLLLPLSPFVVGLGLWGLFLSTFRTIRMDISSKGMTYQTLRQQRWVGWNSVGPFAVAPDGRHVEARVTGDSASSNMARGTKIQIAGLLFDLNNHRLADMLNSARDSALL